MFWVYMIGAVIFDFLGIIMAKQFAETDKLIFLILSMFGFVIMAFFLSHIFRYHKFIIADFIWSAIVMGIVALVSWKYYGETLTWGESLGILCIVIGIVLLQFKPFGG